MARFSLSSASLVGHRSCHRPEAFVKTTMSKIFPAVMDLLMHLLPSGSSKVVLQNIPAFYDLAPKQPGSFHKCSPGRYLHNSQRPVRHQEAWKRSSCICVEALPIPTFCCLWPPGSSHKYSFWREVSFWIDL